MVLPKIFEFTLPLSHFQSSLLNLFIPPYLSVSVGVRVSLTLSLCLYLCLSFCLAFSVPLYLSFICTFSSYPHSFASLFLLPTGILRIIYAFYMGLSRAEAPYVSVPLNCVLQLVPSAFSCEEKVSEKQWEVY